MPFVSTYTTSASIKMVITSFKSLKHLLRAPSRLTRLRPHCRPPGSSVHGIFQARILEWLSFSTPGDLPDPTSVSCVGTSLPLLHLGIFHSTEHFPKPSKNELSQILPSTLGSFNRWNNTQTIQWNKQHKCMNLHERTCNLLWWTKSSKRWAESSFSMS